MKRVVKDVVNSLLRPVGLYVGSYAPSSEVRQIVDLLKPVDCGIELIRVGGDNDGGYLLPDDLTGIKYCFSPGVAETASFERDCLDMGISSFLADYSVDAPPVELPGCEFSKKFIGVVNNGRYMTLDHWVSHGLKDDRDGELILQMDIEGAEYEMLLSTTTETLTRFRIMVVEFHHMDSLRDRNFCQLASSTVRRIREEFDVVHVHPNNFRGITSINGVKIPTVLEATFLRKDRVKARKPVKHLPHPLDQPNTRSKTDITMPSNWS